MNPDRESEASVPDEVLLDRLVDIEVLLAGLGFAAAADPEGCAILAVPKASQGPDPRALWRLLTAPAICLSEEELRSDDYLRIAVERVAGKAA